MPISPIVFIFSLLLVSPLLGASKPNVLFIAIDDLNACLAGMDGETTVATPGIDRLSREGVLFTNAHCAAPACNPSRVSVLTGAAPARSGVYYNWQDWRENALLKSRTTLPQHFRDSGYETRGGGKIYHAASLTEKGFTGLLDPRPWDEYFPSKSRQLAEEILPETRPANGSNQFYKGFFDWAALDIEPEEMGDGKVVAWAEEQLSREHDRPLFLAVGIYRPHIPWYTPRRYFEQHPIDQIVLPEVVAGDLDDVPEAGRRMARRPWQQWMQDNGKWKEAVQAYNASVSFTDDMVGRLIGALRNGPMADNTIVVLWSDHGYHLGQKEHWEKFALWEQTTRVPLIVAAPGQLAAGEICREPVSLLDIFPTLMELTGTSSADEMDGSSLAPLLKNPKMDTSRAVVCAQGPGNYAVRDDRWRYIRYQDGSEELYDQASDPKNFINLSDRIEYAPLKRKLAASLPAKEAELDPQENEKLKKQ